MIYIKFKDLSLEMQEELFRVSREDVEHRFGESIRKYVNETGVDEPDKVNHFRRVKVSIVN